MKSEAVTSLSPSIEIDSSKRVGPFGLFHRGRPLEDPFAALGPFPFGSDEGDELPHDSLDTRTAISVGLSTYMPEGSLVIGGEPVSGFSKSMSKCPASTS